MARRRRSKSTGGLVVLVALFAIGFIIVFGKAVVDYVSWQVFNTCLQPAYLLGL